MAINLFFKYALRSVGGNIEYLATSSMEWVAPNSCLMKLITWIIVTMMIIRLQMIVMIIAIL